ncbi:type VII secretion target [Actinocrispum wychmicini]|uniref:Excreted virulence factor EspC (Type VII ESX diderm) n=1 Tax=Actinocrispum wychmicini TaxID=1213861 RepID=A0A4R2J7H5_9PSEU|nr:type VII secretion target [Actinocrispum wychmicini]TCO52478.1 excreted virulence factor EspC (type VII ESX diderm) [Actinocrispum wychmicini]
MSESYEVVTDALTKHASKLSGLAGELRAALDTASQVTITGDAYGETGQEIASTLDGLGGAGQETLRAAVDALESATAGLRESVGTYDSREATEAARLGGLA